MAGGVFVLHDWTTYVFGSIFVAGCLGTLAYFENYEIAHFDEPNEKQFNEPELKSGQWRLGKTTATYGEDLRDAFVVYKQAGADGPRVGRVVGVEGDKIEVKEEDVLRNGEALKAPVPARKHSSVEIPELIVPRGCVFVLNDVRVKGGSPQTDSRTFGPIPWDSITHVFRPKGKGGEQ